MNTNIQFLEALGVRVEFVNDLNEDCAVFYDDEQRLVLCEHLCQRRQAQAIESAMKHIEPDAIDA